MAQEVEKKPPALPDEADVRPVDIAMEAAAVEKRVQPKPATELKPMFISLDKFRQIKSELAALKAESAQMRSLIKELKTSKSGGLALLKQSADKLEQIERRVNTVSSILRV